MSKFLVTYHGAGMPTDPAMIEHVKAAFEASHPFVARGGTLQVDEALAV